MGILLSPNIYRSEDALKNLPLLTEVLQRSISGNDKRAFGVKYEHSDKARSALIGLFLEFLHKRIRAKLWK